MQDKRKNKEQSLENRVIETIKKYNLIENGDKIVVGVSGGPDSMCLLDNLIKFRNLPDSQLFSKSDSRLSKETKQSQLNPEPVGLVVAHINHMIRKEASEDENYVKGYCEKNEIEFYSKSIDVQKFANNNKIGTEEAGRKIRYEFFEEVMKKTGSNKIAIAHNKNDKVETVIMHILRGCGTRGLIGIEPKRDVYIRPLIECERKEIEEYCQEHNLNPRIDKTNFENIYTRNKIRNVVIPYVKKEFNPNIIETINRLSELVSEEEEYMKRQTEKIFLETLIEEKQEEIILDLKKFNMQEKVIKSRLIRYTITRLLGSSDKIELIHIEDIIKLCSNNIGNKYLLPNKNIKVLVKNQKIYFIKQM